ncbi:MAG: ABC transporter permease [Candidatus Dojkabacteria bacterium]
MVNKESVKKPRQIVSFLALTKASVLMSLRNPTSLFFNFFFPFIFITIFGLLNFGSAKFDVVIRPDSVKEGIVYESLQKIEALNLITDRNNDQIQEDLNKGRIAIALDIKQIDTVQVAPGVVMPKYDLIVDRSAASPQAASSITSIINAVLAQINGSVSTNTIKLVEQKENIIEGRKYEQIDFILPGQLAFALLTNAIFGISFTLMMFKKDLILKRYFATPVKKSSILGSEVMSKTLIAILQASIIIGAGYFIFHFTLANGWVTALDMLVLSLIGILVFLALGLFVVSISKSEDSITPIAQLFMMPQLFLSGAFFPIESFPKIIQPIANVLPMTLLNEAFKKVAFEGVPLSDTFPLIGGLLIWGVVVYLIVIAIFKWE